MSARRADDVAKLAPENRRVFPADIWLKPSFSCLGIGAAATRRNLHELPGTGRTLGQ
jgi:hypothetical protein